jgi:hypothetical protein
MLALDARARRQGSIDGEVGNQDPDAFIAKSNNQQWVGCRR